MTPLSPTAKICGLSTLEHAHLAASLGAGLLGFVHFPASPRHISPADVAPIADAMREEFPNLGLVAVTVNATDEEIVEIMYSYDPDYLQLHGNESPARCVELQERFQVGIIKAFSIATKDDLNALSDYAFIADMLLLDAKPAPDETLPGGNGRPFDWKLLADAPIPENASWLLSGGLNAGNVADAIAQTQAVWVDVSSGVEYQPGQKDPARIRAFFEALRESAAVEG